MKLVFSSMQWAIFILASAVIAPLSVGSAFHMSALDIAQLLQRSFFVIGLSSVLQIVFGHKLPIIEGPAGVWWGVFLIFANVATASGQVTEIWQQLTMGLLISGALFIVFSIFGFIEKLKAIFTPLVTGTYLILLVAQLSGSFIKGMFGIGYLGNHLHVKVTIASFCILLLAIMLSKSRVSFLYRYSILISLLFGWVLFKILHITKPLHLHVDHWFGFPDLFPFGKPIFNGGVCITVIVSTLLLLTNMLASVEAVESVMDRKKKASSNRAGFIMGINQALAGMFSTVGCVPISGSAGFILTTKMREKLPFIIGSLLIMGLGFFPILMLVFASVPVPVGYATMFLAMASIFGIGLKEYKKLELNQDQLTIIGISLMIGFGSMFIPQEALSQVPVSLRTVLNNGLILGVFTCMMLEQLMKKIKES